jgi:hypothetical protein
MRRVAEVGLGPAWAEVNVDESTLVQIQAELPTPPEGVFENTLGCQAANPQIFKMSMNR